MPRFNKMRQADAALCRFRINLKSAGLGPRPVKASVDAFNRADVVQHGGNLPVNLLV
jgi:hypothetical protein